MPTFRIQTLGCKVNQYESLQMAQMLLKRGWRQVSQRQADLVIVHTCSVTTASAGKSRQLVRKEAARGAGVFTVATGCWATGSHDEAATIPNLSAIIGHQTAPADELTTLLETMEQREIASGNRLAQPDCRRAGDPGTTEPSAFSCRQEGNQRAILKVQDGCDAHCTYCIIPQLRPTLWSKPLAEVVGEARRLVEAGHLEIVLTGISLGAYGQATALHRRQATEGRRALPRLVEALCTRVAGLKRLRLSSLEPGDLRDELLQVLAAHPVAVPHFHLSLQSGSNAILRRMNRQYTREDFLERVARVQELFDRPALSSDIITGFPGETEEAFEQTLQVARLAGFIHIHAFPFSPRPGTAAAKWSVGRVPQRLASERVRVLQQLAREQSLRFRRGFVGQEVEVLVETGLSPSGAPHGRCERYFDVELRDAAQTGQLARVSVEQVEGNRTLARVVASRRNKEALGSLVLAFRPALRS